MSTTSNLYFAYGANMRPEQILERCRKPEYLGVARLAGHALSFFGHSRRWDGGEETVVAHAGGEVYGALYRLSRSDEDLLDTWQGVRLNGTGSYFHYPVDVVDEKGIQHAALLYRKTTQGAVMPPSREYLDHIVAGAIARELPAAYIDTLNALPASPASYPVPTADLTRAFAIANVACQC